MDNRLIVLLILLYFFAGCKKPSDQIAIQPIQEGSGWPVSEATYDKTKITALKRAIAQDTFRQITSIVIIKDGALLLEEYFGDATRSTLNDTRSVGKSFASALTGIAIGEGYIKSENQSLQQFYDLNGFANYSPEKDSVTVKDLLTMSSAFEGSDNNPDSPGNEENMYPTENWVKFGLDLSIDRNKANGMQWDYFTAGVILIGDILNQSVPDGLEKYSDRKLFLPMGITNYQWKYTPQKIVSTAGGLQLTSLDLAKFGQLYKNNGLWNDKQLIPVDWIKKTFTKHIEIAQGSNEYYGYLFWNRTFMINGENQETFYCSGNGGNKVYIFKDLPLVIVITATAYNQRYAHVQADKIMTDYILPSILEVPSNQRD